MRTFLLLGVLAMAIPVAETGEPGAQASAPRTAVELRRVVRELMAKAPAPGHEERLRLFGQFIGDWAIETRWFLPDGREVKGEGEVHFDWILDGTAIQDVWSGRVENPPAGYPELWFGSTIRVQDPAADAWRCIWISPRKPTLQMFVARPSSDGIVLEGKTPSGDPERWIYTEVKPASFRWHSEESADGGQTWRTTEVILARRMTAGAR